jgi:N-dimethylarginine dimethylaminohydrolase
MTPANAREGQGWTGEPGLLSEVGTLAELALVHPREGFGSQEQIDTEWRAFNFSAAPEFAAAIDEFDRFVERLSQVAPSIRWLPAPGVGLDAIYVRDASVVCDRGAILCSMGKAARRHEPAAHERAYREWGIPVLGAIGPPGRLEGGDVVWLGPRTVLVGEGYRTNAEGIRQFRLLVGDSVDELIVVPLPHWRGPADVFHLMSILSPVDADLAVVYSPLMPVPLRETLLSRGVSLVEVPDAEFESMGANVLAIAPRRCVVLDGNPATRARLEAAGAEVLVYEGREISLKGGGGPTCLTRPLRRLPVARETSG